MDHGSYQGFRVVCCSIWAWEFTGTRGWFLYRGLYGALQGFDKGFTVMLKLGLRFFCFGMYYSEAGDRVDILGGGALWHVLGIGEGGMWVVRWGF